LILSYLKGRFGSTTMDSCLVNACSALIELDFEFYLMYGLLLLLLFALITPLALIK
jgi:hypothetical protein